MTLWLNRSLPKKLLSPSRQDTIYIGTFIVAIPICLNNSIGAKLRVTYPVAARSSFGYAFSRANSDPYGNDTLLACHSEVCRIYDNDSGYSSHLAFLFRYTQPSTGKHRNNKSTIAVSFHLLDSLATISVDSTTRAALVFRFQRYIRHCCRARDGNWHV